MHKVKMVFNLEFRVLTRAPVYESDCLFVFFFPQHRTVIFSESIDFLSKFSKTVILIFYTGFIFSTLAVAYIDFSSFRKLTSYCSEPIVIL